MMIDMECLNQLSTKCTEQILWNCENKCKIYSQLEKWQGAKQSMLVISLGRELVVNVDTTMTTEKWG